MSDRRHERPAVASAWSYIAGEKGRTRVRAFERADKGGAIWLEYRDVDGRKTRQSLGHRDRQRAKQQAEETALRFRRDEAAARAPVTMARLFEIYEAEVTPKKAAQTQAHDRRTFQLFLEAFGKQRRAETLNQRDWDSFIERRRRGEIAPPGSAGKGVRNRMIEQDLKLLLAVLNWATRSRDGDAFMLERNPLRGLSVPREANPRRPVMRADRFAIVRAKAKEISAAAELFVCLLWFTGHRAASVRQLRWDDIDLEQQSVRWRAEVDKIDYEHRNPLHPELVELLAPARAIAEETRDVWLFPSIREPTQAMGRNTAAKLWRSIARASGIEAGSRLGTHSFRRAFANRLRDATLKELTDLGGWKTHKTVVDIYLQPDQDAQRAALSKL